VKLADILAMNIRIFESQNQWKLKQRDHVLLIGGTFTCQLLPVLDVNKVKQTEICTQGPCHWARQVFRSSKLINHWV